MMDIHDALRSYARAAKFFYADTYVFPADIFGARMEGAQLIAAHTEINPLCSDVLTLKIWKSNGEEASKEAGEAARSASSSIDITCRAITHEGRCCALAHASCEIACELFARTDVARWDDLIRRALLVSEQGTEKSSDKKTGATPLDGLPPVFLALCDQELSAQRKSCLSLVYRGLYTMIHSNMLNQA